MQRAMPRPAPPLRRAGASSGPVAPGYPPCDNVGNTALSCFPRANTTLVQGVYSRFIWNANYPTFIAATAVDAYLVHADSMGVARSWVRMPTEQGMCAILPDDDWWAARKEAQELPLGRNRTWAYYFVVVPTGEGVDSAPAQDTFQAVQTAPPRSVLATLSSASSSTSTSSAPPQSTSGSLQNSTPHPGAGFPKWAIAVIVILGVLLTLTLLGIAIALLRRRTRRDERAMAAGTGFAPRQAYDEKEPQEATPAPPVRHTPSPIPAAGTHLRPGSRTSLYPPITSPPPAPAAGRQRSASYTATTETNPVSPAPATRLSGLEAAAVADAFRQAMRRPDFADMYVARRFPHVAAR